MDTMLRKLLTFKNLGYIPLASTFFSFVYIFGFFSVAGFAFISLLNYEDYIKLTAIFVFPVSILILLQMIAHHRVRNYFKNKKRPKSKKETFVDKIVFLMIGFIFVFILLCLAIADGSILSTLFMFLVVTIVTTLIIFKFLKFKDIKSNVIIFGFLGISSFAFILGMQSAESLKSTFSREYILTIDKIDHEFDSFRKISEGYLVFKDSRVEFIAKDSVTKIKINRTREFITKGQINRFYISLRVAKFLDNNVILYKMFNWMFFGCKGVVFLRVNYNSSDVEWRLF